MSRFIRWGYALLGRAAEGIKLGRSRAVGRPELGTESMVSEKV